MTDPALLPVLQKLVPQKDGEPYTVHRSAVVAAVNAGGTVDLTMSGVTVPRVPVLGGASVGVGDTVSVLAWQGALLVLGATATAVHDTGLVVVTPASAASAGFTVQSGWSLTGDVRYRRHGKVVYLYLYHVTRTGPAITVDSKGDIGNSPIVQLPPALRPGTPVALSSGATGRVGAGYIDTSTGIITLAAVGSATNITTNEMFSFGATYLVP